MTKKKFIIQPERPEDAEAVEAIHSAALGPGRFAKTAYQIRHNTEPFKEGCFVAFNREKIIGTVRLYPVWIGEDKALLLGPLAIHPKVANQGAGTLLMQAAMDWTQQAGERAVLLIGDESYYGRFGFCKVDEGRITLPAPVDPKRLLLADFKSDIPPLQGKVRGKKL